MAHSAAQEDPSSFVNSPIWRTFAWTGVALQGLALLAVLWLGAWTGALSLGIFFAASLAFLLMQDRMPSLISLMVVTAAVINAFGWAWNLFHQYVWYDELIHTFTSFAGMAALSYFAWSRGSFPQAGTTAFIVKTVMWGLGLGILWEVIEFFFLNIGWLDTLADLVLDTIGAAVGGWFASWVIQQQGLAPDQRA